jgi:replicative superfamily II helicase
MLRKSLLQTKDNLKVEPTAYCLTVKQFKDIVDNFDQEEAVKRLSYVYFMCDVHSIYSAYENKQKHIEVSKALFNKTYKVDKYVKAAMEEYDRHDTSAMALLKAARNSIAYLKEWLENIDVTDEDYDPTKHVRILETMGKTTNGLKDLEEAVRKESEVSDTWGGVQVDRYSE